jgi:hypothetical protein
MLAMARQAATTGTRYFSPESAEDTFLNTIQGRVDSFDPESCRRDT